MGRECGTHDHLKTWAYFGNNETGTLKKSSGTVMTIKILLRIRTSSGYMYVNMVMIFGVPYHVRNLLGNLGTLSFPRKSLIHEVIFRRLGLPKANVPFRNPVWHFLKCSFLTVRF
jgi:hypothetical protein